jgi:para-nitrobenzyl esterase
MLVACDYGNDDDDPLVVQTEQGKVKGAEIDGIRSWRGIPYAAPPVDDLRWEPPEGHDDWSGTKSTRSYGAPCIQGGPTPGQTGVTIKQGSSEDCLFLNVNSPKDAEDLPVMVFIHGGGFAVGTGGVDLANSPTLVKRGVVLVTLNYRLARFGFFAHPALGGDIANFGLLDQMQALQWVQDNIDGFGGDPDNVTIFGQSAGGMSVNALMVAPDARGLFDKAIVESGLGREASISFDEASEQGEDFLPDMDADQLRDLDPEKIVGPPQDVVGGDLPVIDSVLPERVDDAFAAGDEADVPYLVGTNSAEFNDSFIQNVNRNPYQLRSYLAGDKRAAFDAAYGGEHEFALHMLSDVIFTEPARFLATSHAARAPTYRYRFSIATPQQQQLSGGAPHSAETYYVFDQAGDNPNADLISDYWVGFATTGDPNHEGAPKWPTAKDDALIDFTDDGPVAEQPDPWDPRLDLVETATDKTY